MDWKQRKDKDSVTELECHIKDVRQQLTEQLKCLDLRIETHSLMLSELQDFYRRRAEVESEYARSMEKLVKQAMTRHRNEKQKRESWPEYSTYTVWQTLLSTTHKLGRDHATLGDLYSTQLSVQMNQLSESIQRSYKKCREMIGISHEELIRVLTELHASMKTYQKYHAEFVQTEDKLKAVENENSRLEQHSAAKTTSLVRRKLKNLEKQLEKKQLKNMESSLKAIKARNEYLLCLEAANSSIQKYFIDNVQEFVDAIDFGYHDTLSHMMQIHVSAEEGVVLSRKGCLDLVNRQVRGLDQLMDKQSFLERHINPFSVPEKFLFQAHCGDQVSQLYVQDAVQDDVLDRMGAIHERLRTLLSESNEASKGMEKASATFLSCLRENAVDVTHLFQEGLAASTGNSAAAAAPDQAKQNSDKLETEDLYLKKFCEYYGSSNLIARLQAKYAYMEKALMDSNNQMALQNLRSSSMLSIGTKRKEVVSKIPPCQRPRLFGGTLEEYIKATGEEIPVVIRSSVRIINLYGMHHQGIFRIPGSQKDINDFRNQFERGKDAFCDKTDGKDMDSVAGVLKLYFRELREPLFPYSAFDDLASFISCRNFHEPSEIARSIYDVRHLLVSSIKEPIFVVMRYFFSFLNHLSEFSDENMMDPFNLAICLGPTLLPVPSNRDLVQFQGHVTELVKNIIIYQEEIFSRSDGGGAGPVYEKCILQVDYGNHSGSRSSLFEDDDILEEDAGSGDDLAIGEARALYDFQARNGRELSFKKGDSITVLERVSADWWEGLIKDQEGLIPDKYIELLPASAAANPVESTGINNKPVNFSGRRSDAGQIATTATTTSTHLTDDCSQCHSLSPVISDSSRSPLKTDKSSGTSRPSSFYRSQSGGSCRNQEKREDVMDLMEKVVITNAFLDSTNNKTTEELKSDIDAALADVFSGIEFLSGNATNVGGRSAVLLQPVVSEPGKRQRPDLVSDLPVGNFTNSTTTQKTTSKDLTPRASSAFDSHIQKGTSSISHRQFPAEILRTSTGQNKNGGRPRSSHFQNLLRSSRQRSTSPDRSHRKSAMIPPNRHSDGAAGPVTELALTSHLSHEKETNSRRQRSVSPGGGSNRLRSGDGRGSVPVEKEFTFLMPFENSWQLSQETQPLRPGMQPPRPGTQPPQPRMKPPRPGIQPPRPEAISSPGLQHHLGRNDSTQNDDLCQVSFEPELGDSIEDYQPSFI